MKNITDINSCANSQYPHSKVSPKYKFVNTMDIVNKFGAYGWTPAEYNESYTKKYQGFQTHFVALEHADMPKVGDCKLRIIVINDHRAGRALQLKLGLFRTVCSNGLVIESSNFDSVSVRHIGNSVDEQVAAFIEKIAVVAEQLRHTIAKLQGTMLSPEQMMGFARKALEVRFTSEKITDDMIKLVTYINRPEDASNDAWSVFNTVQENIIRGFEQGMDLRRVRKITSVKRNLEVNTKLWQVLESELLRAA